MTTTNAARGIALFTEFFDAINSYDLDRMVAVCTKDIHLREDAIDADVHGHEAVRALYEPWLTATSVNLETDDVFATEDRAAAVWRYLGEIKQEMPGLWGPESVGRTFAVPGASLAVLRDGLFSEVTGYYDLATMLRQIGAQS